MTVLYHLGVMQFVVKGAAWVMQRTMRTSGAETLSAAGNIFVGQTEAPLLIKPFIDKMTISELNAVMTGGFATVAGGVMAAYVGYLIAFFPDIAGHLMARVRHVRSGRAGHGEASLSRGRAAGDRWQAGSESREARRQRDRCRRERRRRGPYTWLSTSGRCSSRSSRSSI